VTIEHYYDAAKRVMVTRELADDEFLEEEKTSN
jgi:hypothetical protein